MKKFLILPILLLFSIVTIAQTPPLSGVYLSKNSNGLHTLYMLIDNYISISTYEDGKYIGTQGGPFVLNDSKINIKLEYHDTAPDSVGLQKEINFNVLKATTVNQPAARQDLDALWRITGRQSGDKMNSITRGDRKTIKILVDGYFQWIAINPAEKGFYGTGGGKYTFKDGVYQEHILFFSRDNSRVGQTLTFEGDVKNSDWHHKGKSSKGDPIYEVWSKENP